MITNIVIEERELDGSYKGPIKVEVAQDLQVQNLDGLSEFKKEIEAIKDDAQVSATEASNSATDAAASETKAKEYADSAKPWMVACQTKEQFEARRDANKRLYPASGLHDWGNHRDNASAYNAINEGLWTDLTAPNVLKLGRDDANKVGTSVTPYPRTVIAGVLSELMGISQSSVYNEIELPPAEKGLRTFDSSTSASVVHASAAEAFAAETATNEVVTRRVDMGGGEWFLRKITKTDSYVYHKGNIQSELTTANGVATTVNTQRPSSYFDQYKGQNAGQKRGWDWNSISDDNKLAIVSDFTNLTYWDGKDLYQWCLRVRTFAGAGNGDWNNIDTTNPTLRWSDKERVKPQGNLDSVPTPLGKYNEGHYGWFVSPESGESNLTASNNVGIFASIRTNSAGTGSDSNGEFYAAEGECYFQVWFVVPRLNQGAYHPEFNAFGTKGFWPSYGGPTTPWYKGSAKKPSSVADCFNFGNSHLTSFTTVGGGNIGSTSGREDGRFYDAIYASGLGGVDDYRMTCKDTGKPEYVAGKIPEIINGSYRGAEKLKFTGVEYTPRQTLNGTANGILTADASKYKIGDKVSLVLSGVVIKSSLVITGISGENIIWSSSVFTFNRTSDRYYIIHELESPITVSGEYYQKNIVGDPASILAVFPNGGYWEWIPVIPDGTAKDFILTHPTLGSQVNLDSTNKGVTWASPTDHTNTTTNGYVNKPWPTGFVRLATYKTKARQTQPTTNKAILQGTAGIGDVFLSANYTTPSGRGLGYSLTGKINKSSNGVCYHEAALQSYLIDPLNGKLASYFAPIYTNNLLSTPSNNSGAFKFLWTQFSENKKSNIQFNWSELIHNGTSWGDDGKIHIIDEESKRNDTNGLEVGFGTDELVKPLGFTW